MPEDAPVNPGACPMAGACAAGGRSAAGYGGCRSSCTAGREKIRSRRFGDLFNLVYDPDVPGDAWKRVSGQHRGTDTRDRPGHGGPIENRDGGVSAFLDDSGTS